MLFSGTLPILLVVWLDDVRMTKAIAGPEVGIRLKLVRLEDGERRPVLGRVRVAGSFVSGAVADTIDCQIFRVSEIHTNANHLDSL